jgi:hypothetical protein
MRLNNVEREVLNPLADIDSEDLTLNPLPDDFESVSLVDNTKPGADIILSIIRKELGNREFLSIKMPAGAPATTAQILKASSSDIAIMALGDCGSCTSWVVLDALRIEKEGTPTIIICSDLFIDFARELSTSQGALDLRILEIEHPIAGISRKEIEEKTFKIVRTLQYLLQIP